MPAPGTNAVSRSPAASVAVSNPSSAERPTVGAAVVMRCMGDPVARGPLALRDSADSTPAVTHAELPRRRETAPAGVATSTTERTAMATLCRAYPSESDAQAAVERLLSAGVAGADVRVLMGDAVHDARDAPVGGYAGTTTADGETVGAY